MRKNKILLVACITVLLSSLLSSCSMQGKQGIQGIQGEQGEQGIQGVQGEQGEDGKSAYESYCKMYDYKGTEEEWLSEFYEALNNAKKICEHIWTEQTCQNSKTCLNCGLVDGNPLECNYVNGMCDTCGGFDEDYCFEIYQKLRAEMITMENRVESFEAIEEYLASLPNQYKDVATIKEDLIFLKAQHDVFTDALFRKIMKQIISDTTLEEYKEYYVDYSKVRRAYLNLINNQQNYPNWNVANIANNYIFTGDEDSSIFLYVFVGLWEDSAGNYINVVENATNDITFGSNLPNSKVASKSYYYFVEGRVIGYCLQSDQEQKISAYRIDEIGEDYIKIFCFKDSIVYTLRKA